MKELRAHLEKNDFRNSEDNFNQLYLKKHNGALTLLACLYNFVLHLA